MRRLVYVAVLLTVMLPGGDVRAQRGEKARLPDANSPKNDPEGGGAVQQIAKDFKGKYDLAGAAEALVKTAGSKFHYDYGFDVQNPLYHGLNGVSSMNGLFAQRLLVCYEFVHYLAYLTGAQRTTASGNPMIVGTDDSVWDKNKFTRYRGGPIPRGKVVIFKGIAFNNKAGFYHVGVSLGNGKIAHNSSNGNVQISDFSDVDSIGYSSVWVGDYPWKKNLDPGPTSTTDATPSTPTANSPTVAPSEPAERGSTGLRDALDAAPGGMRLADNASCCGDPLGNRVATTPAAPKPQYQMLITGGGIERSINYSPLEQQWALRSRHSLPQTIMSVVSWLWTGSVVHAAQRPSEAPMVSLIATGRSSGDALRVAINAPVGYSGRLLASDAMVVEATSATAPVPADGSRPGVDVSGLTAFCAQFTKLTPAPGTIYRVASDAMQAKFRPMRKLLRAADALQDAGRLHPDAEPGGYLTFIKQYALWTALEGWNAKSFEEHVIEKGRDAAVATGRKWTRELEAAVRKSIPGRWADVQQVIAAAR